jgi:hypothetical protein
MKTAPLSAMVSNREAIRIRLRKLVRCMRRAELDSERAAIAEAIAYWKNVLKSL